MGVVVVCYTQALGVVIVRSLLVELSGRIKTCSGHPPVMPHKGRTLALGKVVGGSQGKGVGHEGLQMQ